MNRHRKLLAATAVMASFFVTVAPARADEPPKAKVQDLAKLEAAPKLLGDAETIKRKPGWDYKIGSAATLSLSDNRGVAGQADGTAFAFGFKSDTALALNHGAHEWRNGVSALANITKTPAIDRVIKGADLLSVETIYLYHIVETFGLFARGKMQTSMFRGTDVRTVPITYAIAHTNGAVENVPGSVLPLSDPFRPMTITESAGIFVQPYRRPPFNLEVRTGPGAQQIFAKNQLGVTDDAATLTTVEITELDDAFQLGPEVDLAIWGELRGKKLTYRFEAGAMMPLLHSELKAGDNRNAVDLTNFNLLAQISVHVVEWASLDYDFRLVRQPQLIDTTQVQNNLFLTIGVGASSEPLKAAPAK